MGKYTPSAEKIAFQILMDQYPKLRNLPVVFIFNEPIECV